MASFDFFRKHQKSILYTAGLFALLTFSISGPMTSWFTQLTARGFRGASLMLGNGRKTYVTSEDHQIAQALATRPLVPPLIPAVGGERPSEGDRVEIFAAVRRLAIEYGIEGSMVEAREAITAVLNVWPKKDGVTPIKANDLPRYCGLSSDQYELLMRESLRIATFLRMFALAGDTSDAQLAEKLAKDVKLVTLKLPVQAQKSRGFRSFLWRATTACCST